MADIQTLSTGLADAVAAVGQSLVEIRASRRPGTGIAWSPEFVVTANHVVRRDDGIVVVAEDGKERTASLVGRDSSTDLALLQVEGPPLVPVTWVEDVQIRVGELVMPVGRVQGRVRTTLGIVSDVHGAWQTSRGGQVDTWIEVDGSLPHGFSGGPLVAASGKVVGVNTTGLTRRGAILPYATVARVVNHLEQHGSIQPGYLGVGFYPGDLPDDVASVAGQKDALMTVSLEPGGPGDQAGMQVGDALVRLDGAPVTGLRHLIGLLTSKGSSHEVVLTVVRAGSLVDVRVQLGARPTRRGWCG
ncbi:MAG: S1C family serine protease [Myxococcales bacterium]|nr:S1C family serine protease [Myxococcales bacterium]